MQRSITMNLNLEDFETPQTPHVHKSAGASPARGGLARSATSMITLDVSPRVYTDIDLKVKDDDRKDYSPIQKSTKPRPVSRIHAIPLLVLFVFVLLWATSSEIMPNVEGSDSEFPEPFVVRVPSPENVQGAAEEVLKTRREIGFSPPLKPTGGSILQEEFRAPPGDYIDTLMMKRLRRSA